MFDNFLKHITLRKKLIISMPVQKGFSLMLNKKCV